MRIGVDLGGTKIEAIALDASGAERMRVRVPTPRNDYRATVAAIAGLVRDIERQLGRTGSVGVGTPGAPSTRDGRMKNANSTCLNGQPLQLDLESALDRPVRMANDANCFAVSEAVDGAGRDAAVVFGVILGTGVGGGLVIDGQPLTGANAIAGEWGHIPLADDAEAMPCYCGRFGCVETWLSGPGLAADHQRQTGQGLDAVAIASAAARGDAACEATLGRYESRLARALSVVINIVDPDVIVLGGGLSQLSRLYDNVPRLWVPHVFSDTIATRLLPPVHGDSSGVRGAAWLWSRDVGA
jgi:predicted NBD/HSP70 family sugar kinase